MQGNKETLGFLMEMGSETFEANLIPSKVQMIEIPVSDRAISLMKAYAALNEGGIEDISKVLGDEIGYIVEAKLWDLVNGSMGERPGSLHGEQNVIGSSEHPGVYFSRDKLKELHESTSIADLGDQDNDDDDGRMTPKMNWTVEPNLPIEPVQIEEFAHEPASVSQGLRDEDLENDLMVNDPTKEAVGEAISEEINSDEQLMKVMGMMEAYMAKKGKPLPSTPEVTYNSKTPKKGATVKASPGKPLVKDSRAARRNKKLTGFKGKVSAFNGNEASLSSEL